MLHSLGSIRYCKAELFKECILGTIRLPQKNEQKKHSFHLDSIWQAGKCFCRRWRKNEGMDRKADGDVSGSWYTETVAVTDYGAYDRRGYIVFSHMESELDKLEEKISGGTGSNNNFLHHW